MASPFALRAVALILMFIQRYICISLIPGYAGHRGTQTYIRVTHESQFSHQKHQSFPVRAVSV